VVHGGVLAVAHRQVFDRNGRWRGGARVHGVPASDQATATHSTAISAAAPANRASAGRISKLVIAAGGWAAAGAAWWRCAAPWAWL
jgi:MoxR-like ATPase